MRDQKQENKSINTSITPLNAENRPLNAEIQAQNAEKMAKSAQLDVQLLTSLVERLQGDQTRDLGLVFAAQKSIFTLDENYQAMKELIEEFVVVLELLDQRITRLEMAQKREMARPRRPDRQTRLQTEGDRSHPAPQSAARPRPEAPTAE